MSGAPACRHCAAARTAQALRELEPRVCASGAARAALREVAQHSRHKKDNTGTRPVLKPRRGTVCVWR